MVILEAKKKKTRLSLGGSLSCAISPAFREQMVKEAGNRKAN